jgi:CheY-like chemotaxis protein
MKTHETGFLANVSVLCVDNHTDSLEMLKLTLELHGARVHAAISADEAVRMFSAHRPSILISDLALARGTGIDLLTALRKRDPALAAIALTGISDANVRSQALEAGFDRYFVKPVDDHALIDAVADLASKNRKHSA